MEWGEYEQKEGALYYSVVSVYCSLELKGLYAVELEQASE